MLEHHSNLGSRLGCSAPPPSTDLRLLDPGQSALPVARSTPGDRRHHPSSAAGAQRSRIRRAGARYQNHQSVAMEGGDLMFRPALLLFGLLIAAAGIVSSQLLPASTSQPRSLELARLSGAET